MKRVFQHQRIILNSPPRNISILENLQSTLPARSTFDVSWQAPTIGVPLGYTLQISKTGSENWSPAVSTSTTNHTFSGLERGSYTVRIAAIFPNGQISTYLEKTQSADIFAQATADVGEFKISVLSSSSNLSWSPSDDDALSHYEVRYSPLLVGVNWATASILRTNIKSAFVDIPTLKGTYLIKAVTISGFYSFNAISVVNSIDPLNSLNVIDTVEDAPEFTGSKDRTRVADGVLSLTYLGDVFTGADVFAKEDVFMSYGGIEPVGYYYFDDVFDLGSVYISRLSSRAQASAERIGANVFDADDVFATSDVFGGLSDSVWDLTIEYRVTDDDPDSSPIWSDWSELVTSDISGRAFEFRAKLESFQTDVNIEVSSLEIAIDMADRVIADNDLTIPIAGKVIAFDPAYRELQGVAIAAQEMTSGDYYEITNKTKSGFTVQFKNSSGTPIERSMDYVAKGYGELSA